ncbi:hypothetical protein DMH27_19445 [Raoultella planticola]|nr:hypothetical protein [Raoultella planticola]
MECFRFAHCHDPVRDKCFAGYSKLFQDSYESFAQLKQSAGAFFPRRRTFRRLKCPLLYLYDY